MIRDSKALLTTVTADCRALLLFTQRKTGEEVKLGGHGKGVEACLLFLYSNPGEFSSKEIQG